MTLLDPLDAEIANATAHADVLALGHLLVFAPKAAADAIVARSLPGPIINEYVCISEFVLSS